MKWQEKYEVLSNRPGILIAGKSIPLTFFLNGIIFLLASRKLFLELQLPYDGHV